jgi:hypothetical protein
VRLLVLASTIVALALVAGCDDSVSPEPSTDAVSGIEQSQRDLLRECLADPDACGSSESIQARREALRACARSPEAPACQSISDEVTVLTPKLIESCVKKTDGTVIESLGRKALKPQNLAEADVVELLRLCHRGTI